MKAIATLACVSALVFTSCASPRRDLQPVTLPDLSRLDAPVQAQVRDRYDALRRALDQSSTPPADLAVAFGQYGMVLQAAEFFDVAEPPYLNAQKLSPDDPQWPYYIRQVDVRIGKILRFGRTKTSIGIDIYNVTNSNAGLTFNQQFGVDGATFMRPLTVLYPRFMRFNATVDF